MPVGETRAFDTATAVRPSGEPGFFETDVDAGWAVGDKPNGGYLQALLGRAARTTGRGEGQPGWEVQSAAVTYLRPPTFGRAVVAPLPTCARF